MTGFEPLSSEANAKKFFLLRNSNCVVGHSISERMKYCVVEPRERERERFPQYTMLSSLNAERKKANGK